MSLSLSLFKLYYEIFTVKITLYNFLHLYIRVRTHTHIHEAVLRKMLRIGDTNFSGMQ